MEMPIVTHCLRTGNFNCIWEPVLLLMNTGDIEQDSDVQGGSINCFVNNGFDVATHRTLEF